MELERVCNFDLNRSSKYNRRLSGSAYFISTLQQIICDDDCILVDYTLTESSLDLLPSSFLTPVRKHIYNLDLSALQQGLPLSSFDIIIGIHCLGFATDLSRSLLSLNDLLLPGGTLILCDIVEQPSSNRNIGTKWVNCLFEPSWDWPGLYPNSGKHRKYPLTSWCEYVVSSGFSEPFIHQDGLCNPLGFTLTTQSPSIAPFYRHPVVEAGAKLPTVVSFRLAHTLELQTRLAGLMETQGGELWIEATSDAAGSAARGFTRSLRKELSSITLRLVLFDAVWTGTERLEIIRKMSRMPHLESEIMIREDGRIMVPRIVPSPSPRNNQPVDPGSHWVADDNAISPSTIPTLTAHHVSIRVLSSSAAEGGLRGIVGRVINGGSTRWLTGATVLGVTAGALSNCAVIHEGQIIALDDVGEGAADHYASAALPIVFTAFALGISSIRHPERFENRVVLVTDSISHIGSCILQTLGQLGVQAVPIPNSLSLDLLSRLSSCDLVISGYAVKEQVQFICSAMGEKTSLFLWNTAAEMISRDPWLAGDALRELLALFPLITVPSNASNPDIQKSGLSVVHRQLFDPKKTYLLVGGVGSLGIQIALWMYEVSLYAFPPGSLKLNYMFFSEGPVKSSSLHAQEQ